jgi:nucleotide-binding universal stress UspA family protein
LDGVLVNEVMNIERILCPIDLTQQSNTALKYAAALARAYGAKLFVCYCAEELAAAGTVRRGQYGDGIMKSLERSLEPYVRSATDVTEIDLETVIAEGSDPAEGISRKAAELSVDLVVMCSRRRPLRAAFIGSTAESVYRTAPAPVLVTHPDQREWVGESSKTVNLKRVLVAHDFSDYSELALRYGLLFAEKYQAELHLLHVVSAPILSGPELAWVPSSIEGAYHKAALGLQRTVQGEAYRRRQVRHTVRWGKPYREILSYANEQKIDLICLGAHGSGFGMHTLLGSNADRVMRQSPCPILVARSRRPAIA